MKKRIDITPDAEHAARMYVFEQLQIMERYGDRPKLSDARLEQLIYDCAVTIMEARKRKTVASR